jgi:hypothetical protein
MKIKELKEKIKNLPDNMDVFVAERKTEFAYGLINSAIVKKINLVEDPDGEVLAQENVFILDEE